MIPTDNDFHLVVVVCYIRLQKLTDAKELLDQILARDPNNEKALFHSSYVNRQNGRLKDAIANLSKIIAYYDSYKKASSFPISRIYETRGTLFHQLQGKHY